MLHHDVQGQGPTVLLLHSGGMSGRQWRKLAERLSPSYCVVAPDFLGSGDNPPWPDETPFDFHADVTAAIEVLDSFGSSAHVVGHSYGGLVALTLARLRPEAVRSLAVYDPVAFGVLHGAMDEEGLSDLATAATNPAFLDDAVGGQEPWLEAFVDYWNGAGTWKMLPVPTRTAFLKVGRKVYYEVRSLLADRTPASAYGVVHAKTLLLAGQRSPVSARRVVAQLAQAMPAAHAQLVAGAGHMGPITHVNDVNALVEKHIDAATVAP